MILSRWLNMFQQKCAFAMAHQAAISVLAICAICIFVTIFKFLGSHCVIGVYVACYIRRCALPICCRLTCVLLQARDIIFPFFEQAGL